MYSDRTLVCTDCGAEFIFTAGEQEFYASKGFASDPRRCRECRRQRSEERSSGKISRTKETFETVCAECGKTASVPFRPRQDKPVYCYDCFKKHSR